VTRLQSCLDEVRVLAERIGRPVKLMEVCGTHTMAAFRTGLRSLLPPSVSLISGPGCPVCVTPNSYLDRALAIAAQPGVIVATFGDMLRVPGTQSSLERARALGADVRVVYSPLDALRAARERPDRRVVFLGVGFETTAPAVAWTVGEAAASGVANYSVLCAHKTIPGAMAALMSGEVRIDGFLCPGHVSVVIGSDAFRPVCERFRVPCVVAGFEAADMAEAIRMILRQVRERRASVEVEYTRSVRPEGNAEAQRACAEVFESCDVEWRGVGMIPGSGLRLRARYAAQDAETVFAGVTPVASVEPPGCRCGDVLRGAATPPDCPLFGGRCTPRNPVGACMVSSEGTCAAHFKYGRART
jgi:hydrogenase expression/formation protein HypD